MARSPTLTAALAEFKLTTCGDSSCMYGPAGGMMTNGGCRCLARSTTPGDLRHASHVARRLAHLARKLAAQVDQARAEVAALRAALALHKTAAGPAESVHAALGVSNREAARAAMEHGVPCPTCGAESSPPTDAPAPCAHLDRAHDGSCFGCGRGEDSPNPEDTP